MLHRQTLPQCLPRLHCYAPITNKLFPAASHAQPSLGMLPPVPVAYAAMHPSPTCQLPPARAPCPRNSALPPCLHTCPSACLCAAPIPAPYRCCHLPGPAPCPGRLCPIPVLTPAPHQCCHLPGPTFVQSLPVPLTSAGISQQGGRISFAVPTPTPYQCCHLPCAVPTPAPNTIAAYTPSQLVPLTGAAISQRGGRISFAGTPLARSCCSCS